jgi:hypothetical protein
MIVKEREKCEPTGDKIMYQWFFRKATEIDEFLTSVEKQFGTVQHCPVKGV